MEEILKLEIQKLLGVEIALFVLKGSGAINNAYYVETLTGDKLIVKCEKEIKDAEQQNNLVTEANIINILSGLDLNIPVPKVIFISEKTKMYGYKYIDGETLKSVWSKLTEEKRIYICKQLGIFHAEIGKKFTRKMAEEVGIQINLSANLHMEVVKEYSQILANEKIPEYIKILARQAKDIFDSTNNKAFFQFIHNDAHYENILINDEKISGYIDYDRADYGDITQEFSRYIRDFPDYFQYIVSSYEEASGNVLSLPRLFAASFLNGLIDNVELYFLGDGKRKQAENPIGKYKNLLDL
jgi:aminoglycoside phosphotransferase (APT) family kinase protein